MTGVFRIRAIASIATISTSIAPASAIAQESAATGLEEVVVSAQRRLEDLQRTPIAVTALSTQSLEDRSVTTAQELMQVVPSLQVSTQTAGNGSGSATFFLRGLGQQRGGNGSQPAVGIYVDDFYYPSLNGTVFSILDIQQIEVLRGPQGTLFGRNTIGGAIRYTTKKPDKDLGGSLSVTYGSFDRLDIAGVVNMPLGEKVSVRVTGGDLDNDGFVRRESTGGRAGGSSTRLGRAQLRIEPTAAMKIDLAAQYTKSEIDGYAYRLPGPYDHGIVTTIWNTAPAGPIAAARAALGSYDARYTPTCDYCQPGTRSSLNPEEFADTVEKSANGVVSWDLNEQLTLKSLTGYTQVRTESITDLDGSPLPILGIAGVNFIKAISEELQLNGYSLNGTLKWVGGLYYNDEEADALGWHGIGTIALGATRPPNPTTRDTENEAGYIDLTWQATDSVSLLGGFRYSTENKEITRRGATTGTSAAEKTFSSTTGRIGLQYQWTPDVMSYLTVSQGFRSGGFNVLPVATPATPTAPSTFFESFDPEKSTTYELGARATLFEDRLRVNPTIFYNQWDKIQVQRFDFDVPTAQQVIHLENAGKAHTYGLEIEADTVVTRSLHLFANLATLKAKYDSVGTANGITKDSSFQRAPELTYGLGGSYIFDLGRAGTVTGTINYSWQDDQASTPTDSSNPPLSRRDALLLPSYDITNVRLEYRDASSHWSVAAFVTNIFDELYFVGGVDYPESSAHFDLGRPREYGMTVRYTFQ